MDVEHNTQQAIVHCEGWLDKAPPMKKFSGYKSCNKRYFRLLQMNPENDVLLKKTPRKGSKQMSKLEEFYLVYWSNEEVQKKPLRAIPIKGSETVSKFHRYENEERNLIHFLTEDRIYLFFAGDEAEMNLWHQKFSLVIDCANGTLSKTCSSMSTTNQSISIDNAIYESMDDQYDSTWSINTTTESSNPVNDGNTQRFSTYTNYSNYPCSSVSPGDSVSQAGQKPIQEAGGSGVYQKVLRAEQTDRQMSEDIPSMLRRHHGTRDISLRRCQTSDGVLSLDGQEGDPREQVDTERRPFSIATTDIRIGDIRLSNTDPPPSTDLVPQNICEGSQGFRRFSQDTQTLTVVQEETDKKIIKNNYSLTINDKSLTLTVYNNGGDGSNNCVAGKGFNLEYGQYVIDVKKVDNP